MTLDIIFFAIGIPRNNDVTMVFALHRITTLIRTSLEMLFASEVSQKCRSAISRYRGIST